MDYRCMPIRDRRIISRALRHQRDEIEEAAKTLTADARQRLIAARGYSEQAQTQQLKEADVLLKKAARKHNHVGQIDNLLARLKIDPMTTTKEDDEDA